MKKSLFLCLLIWAYVVCQAQAQSRWKPINTENTPTPRGFWLDGHYPIWTGKYMVIWDGDYYEGKGKHGRYDPKEDKWLSISPHPTRTEESYWGSVKVWTGSKMIVWGGVSKSETQNTGGIYDPHTDKWSSISKTNAPPQDLSGATAVWTGSEMIIWGGYSTNKEWGYEEFSTDIYIYSMANNSWRRVVNNDAPTGRYLHCAVWTGTEMIIWGGVETTFDSPHLQNGGVYNPKTNTWRKMSMDKAPQGRVGGRPIWTGTEMIIWSADVYDFSFSKGGKGGRYNPKTNTWKSISEINSPAVLGSNMVWTEKNIWVWGGEYNSKGEYITTKSGAEYDLNLDTWTPIDSTGLEQGNSWAATVWTGKEIIIWGGHNTQNGILSTKGWIYTPEPPCPISTITTEKQTCVDSLGNYEQSLLVHFLNDVKGKTLILNNQSFTLNQNPQPITLKNLKANGQSVHLEATIEGSSLCKYEKKNAFIAPSMPSAIFTSTDKDNIIKEGSNVTFTFSEGYDDYHFYVDDKSVQKGKSNTFSTSSLIDGNIVKVEAFHSNLCSTVSASIQNFVNSKEINSYPNPAHDIVSIVLTNPEKGRGSISIINAVGKEILTEVFEKTEEEAQVIKLNIEKLSSGLYFVQVTMEDIQYTLRFLKR